MRCEICNKSPIDDGSIILWRVNETGVDGVWRCTRHVNIGDLQSKILSLQQRAEKAEKEKNDAVGEMNACHKCWDDFTAKVLVVLPEMKNAPLFQQAETIVNEINRLDELVGDSHRLIGELVNIEIPAGCRCEPPDDECGACAFKRIRPELVDLFSTLEQEGK